MEISEFSGSINFCPKSDDHFMKYTGSAYFIFQFHMIAHLDDVFRFQRADFTPNLEYPFVIKCKMRWSENVLEERDALDQVILGAMDPAFCTILVILIHLEHLWGGLLSTISYYLVKKKREFQACSGR